MQVQDRSSSGFDALLDATNKLAAAANQQAGLEQVFTTFRIDSPRIFVDIDRTQARMLNVPLPRVFDALEVYLGSVFVNEFNFLGRTYRVTAQAQPQFRDEAGDIRRLRTRKWSPRPTTRSTWATWT